MKKITFNADSVKIRTGKPDNGAEVIFSIGEYSLDQIKDLVTVIDKNLKVTVEEYDA